MERYLSITLLAIELTTRYEDGFLPRVGGWYDQDHFHTMLIQEGLSAKRSRERTEQLRKAAQSRR